MQGIYHQVLDLILQQKKKKNLILYFIDSLLI